MPGKLNESRESNCICDGLTEMDGDIHKSQNSDEINANECEIKNNWFKTWPNEKNYDKLNQISDSNMDSDSTENFKSVKSQIPLNKLLDKIPLAYSPITKQIHILTSNENKILTRENYRLVDDNENVDDSDEDTRQFWTSSTTPQINNEGNEMTHSKNFHNNDDKINVFEFKLHLCVDSRCFNHLCEKYYR